MQADKKYDVAIAGGGLAGLTLAIQLADSGRSCILFEKNKYPFHKVCGEYISMESWNFLSRLGLELKDLDLPKISKLRVSSPSGKVMDHRLDLGGFGISRYMLDSKLVAIAKRKGVEVIEECKVHDIRFTGEGFILDTEKGSFVSGLCAGAWGKRSNLDTRLKREFTGKNKAEKNYVGIKYHVSLDFPADVIELHNFENGYCGISKVEGDRYCMCYLSDSDNIKKYYGDIRLMEKQVLMKNPFLKQYFEKAKFLYEQPLAISQIKIGCKLAVENHILMVGDTAGNIAPLSGNGMSMAMRSSFILHDLILCYLDKKSTRAELERKYEKAWKGQFKKRIDLSAILQRMLKNTSLTDLTISSLRRLPALRDKIVRSTHGKPF